MSLNAKYSNSLERPEDIPDDAVPSPWTESAWIMAAKDVPEGWENRGCVDVVWKKRGFYYGGAIVEARPKIASTKTDNN